MDDKVVDSRQSKDGLSTRRRRICLDCGHRFTTYEEIERADLKVQKRDGRTEQFDRHKLIGGVLKACEKRPISPDEVERLVDDVTSDLENLYGRVVSSRDIGVAVMERLHSLDEVAYVRYASVYRAFEDVGEFLDTIKALERKTKSHAAQVPLFPSRT